MSSRLHIMHTRHPRDWKNNLYVYPVISRRSRGLSIGINLNPDKACNFDCIYCQVDRSAPPAVRKVDLDILQDELDHMVRAAAGGGLFEDAPWREAPAELRRLSDIAFSGDGEPTTCPQFETAVNVAIEVKKSHAPRGTKIILITDACYLTKPGVIRGLEYLDQNDGEIWAKLDAGTEEYYRLINRPNYSLAHVLENIAAAARIRPLVIQSLWMRVHGEPPPPDEIRAFCGRLNDIISQGGRIKLVQIYTVARRPAQSYVGALGLRELDEIAQVVAGATGLATETFGGADQDA